MHFSFPTPDDASLSVGSEAPKTPNAANLNAQPGKCSQPKTARTRLRNLNAMPANAHTKRLLTKLRKCSNCLALLCWKLRIYKAHSLDILRHEPSRMVGVVIVGEDCSWLAWVPSGMAERAVELYPPRPKETWMVGIDAVSEREWNLDATPL